MRAVNLIPAEQRSGASVGAGRSQGAVYAVLVLLAGLAVLAVLYGMARHDISSRTKQAAEATAKAQRVNAEAERLAPYTSFVSLRQQRTKQVESLVESRFDWAHLFHELGRVLPPGIASITSLTGQVGTSSASAASSAGGSSTPPGTLPTFTLDGCAIGQGAVAIVLERLRLIDGVSEVSLNSSTTGPAGSSGGSGGSAGGGGCPTHDPAFTIALTFDPLPSESAIAAASKSVSDSSGAQVKKAGAKSSHGAKSAQGGAR